MRKRKLDCVLLLIRAGVKGLGDGAFLREALRAGDSDAAVALVKAGEDPELADPETGEWPLYVAAAKNLVRVLEALRAGGRADMTRVGGDGGSLDPARAAAAAGHGDALRLLHVAGVDLRARARVGDWTKLMRKKIKNAIRAGDLELHVLDGAARESDMPNFKGSDLGHVPLVSADVWTSDHLSERSRSVDVCFVTRARGTLTLKRR